MVKTIKKQEFSGNLDDIRVIPDLEILLPSQTIEASKALEEELIAEGGATDELWLWGDILVDGHNSLRLCRKNNLPFGVKQVFAKCKTIEDVKFRMRRNGYGQRNFTINQERDARAKNTQYLVEKKGMSKGNAVKQVAKDAGVSERQIHRDYARAEKIASMEGAVQESAAVAELSDSLVEKFALLPGDEQVAAVERTGDDPIKLTAEIKRMQTVEGSTLYNADKAKKVQQRKKKLERESGLALFAVFQNQLGAAMTTLRALKKEFKIRPGTFNRIQGNITKVDEDVAGLKPE